MTCIVEFRFDIIRIDVVACLVILPGHCQGYVVECRGLALHCHSVGRSFGFGYYDAQDYIEDYSDYIGEESEAYKENVYPHGVDIQVDSQSAAHSAQHLVARIAEKLAAFG